MINLDPETGDQNPRVLKAVAHSHQGQAGLYANVLRPGRIRLGDAHPSNCKPSIVNAVLIADVVKSQYERDQR